jgi:hypothetical protein
MASSFEENLNGKVVEIGEGEVTRIMVGEVAVREVRGVDETWRVEVWMVVEGWWILVVVTLVPYEIIPFPIDRL